jgi:PAS domain S-box-containing protein
MKADNKQYRILVIEDNAGDYFIVEDFLKQKMKDPFVVQAVNFKQASFIISAGNANLDIILLDLNLSDKCGKQLMTEILQIASCPVIILTGNSDIEFSIKSIADGVSDYLIKDELDSTMLYKSISYAIERTKIISQLKESEKLYNDLFHLNPQPVFVYEANTLQILDANNAAISQYGYTMQEFLTMNIWDINTDENISFKKRNEVDMNIWKSFFLQGNCRHRRKNAEVIEVEVQSNSIVFKGLKAELMVAYDITERLDHIKVIEGQNKRLSEIAWMQSHVMREPLSRMMGLIDLIKNYSLTDFEKKGLLTHLLSSAIEVDNLIRHSSEKTELENLALCE